MRDLIVLGGGAGGLVVASGCAQLGLKVTLIEKAELLGGDCLHYGCVPSKTLIHSSYVANLMKEAGRFGVPAFEPTVDLAKINERVASVIAKIQVHDSVERFESLGVEVLFGEAKFADKKTLMLNDKLLQAKRFVVATGSRPLIPPIKGIDTVDYLTNETIFKAKTLPEHLVVLGGGPIGVELGQAMARLGAKVTLIEGFDNILGMFDSEVAQTVAPILEKDEISLHVGTKLVEVKKGAAIECVLEKNGKQQTIQASHLLIATGRRPNIENLGLDKAGVEHSPQGIKINRKLKTTNRKIYAVGDVTQSPYKLTHVAEYQAGIIIANVAFKFPKKANYDFIPGVVYTHPEIAQIGQTQAKDDKKISVLKVHFADIDRALATGETEGFVKLFVRKKAIVGAVMVGPQVGELLAELTLAIQYKLSLGQISATIHAYPTLSQVVRRTVNTHFAPKLFSAKTKKIVGLLQKLP